MFKKILFLIICLSLSGNALGEAQEVSASLNSSKISSLLQDLQLYEAKERKDLLDLPLTTLTGEEVSLKDYQGQVILLNFWSTDCSACRLETPYLEALYRRYQDKGLVVLAVNGFWDKKKDVELYITKYNLTFPHLVDPTGAAWTGYRVRFTPTTYLIDKEGKILAAGVGARNWKSRKSFTLIEALLAEGGAEISSADILPHEYDEDGLPTAGKISLVVAFLAGIAFFISPCVFPLIPSYISYITGISFDRLKESGGKIRRITFVHSLLFFLGFSLIFVALGASFSYLGQFLSAYLPFIQKLGGGLIILLGLFIAGVFKLPFLMKEKRLISLREHKVGYLSSFLVGLSFSAGWTACATPILSSILIYASVESTVTRGIILLSSFSLGLGLPFIISSLFINSFLNVFSKLQKYLGVLKVVSGLLLVIFGVLVLTNRLYVFLSLPVN